MSQSLSEAPASMLTVGMNAVTRGTVRRRLTLLYPGRSFVAGLLWLPRRFTGSAATAATLTENWSEFRVPAPDRNELLSAMRINGLHCLRLIDYNSRSRTNTPRYRLTRGGDEILAIRRCCVARSAKICGM